MPALDRDLVAALRRLDTCRVANAIETFNVRLRNEGFTNGRVRCMFDDLPPVVGYAVTARIKSSTPPPVGHNYYDRTDWWTYLASVPAPRILVAEDIDDHPGAGALVGEVHGAIFQALGCVAYVTNGAVRDLPAVHDAGLQLFAGSVSVSHAFVHLVEFGAAVTIAGLSVASGDLLHGDRHGLVSVPSGLAAEIPRVADDMSGRERQVISFCRSPRFSIEQLRTLVKSLG